ncbi:MAG: hypothetical protein ACLSDQ_03905 [Adlercreutzia equolifaciens]
MVFERRSYLIETFADLNLGRSPPPASVPYGDDFSVKWSPADGAYVKGCRPTASRWPTGGPCRRRLHLREGERSAHLRRGVQGAAHKALVAVTSTGGGTAALAGSGGPAFDPGQSAAVGWVPDEGHEVRGAPSPSSTPTERRWARRARFPPRSWRPGLRGPSWWRTWSRGTYRLHVDFAPRQFAIARTSPARAPALRLSTRIGERRRG